MDFNVNFMLLFVASCFLIQFPYSSGQPTGTNTDAEVKVPDVKNPEQIENPSFSLNPFSYLDILMPNRATSTPTTTSTTTSATTITRSPLGIFGLGLNWLGGSGISTPPLTIPTVATAAPDDRCKTPLKHFLSNLVVKISAKMVSYEPMVTDTAKKMQSDMAGAITDTIIENGLKEGNIAGVGSEVVGAQFRFVPLVGARLAAIAEPMTKQAITVYLESLCKLLNCCFN